MPAKLLVLANKADKNLSKLPLKIQKRILEAFHKIKNNPMSGIKLHGQLNQFYKYRVGDYRIVYFLDTKKNRIEVLKIEHRQGVYK